MLYRTLSAAIMMVAVHAAAVTGSLQAQAAPTVVGRWSIEWELGRIVENDDVRTIKAAGTLTITESGDSLIATIDVRSRSDNAPLPRPSTIGGRRTADGATFVQLQQVRMNMNGEEHVRQAKVTWTVRAKGDALTGEMQREIEGATLAGPAASAVSGTRLTS
jgi:hypothetical protein